MDVVKNNTDLMTHILTFHSEKNMRQQAVRKSKMLEELTSKRWYLKLCDECCGQIDEIFFGIKQNPTLNDDEKMKMMIDEYHRICDIEGFDNLRTYLLLCIYL